jgi:hypothetical protein
MSLCNRYTIALQFAFRSLCDRFGIAVNLHCVRRAIPFQSLCNRCAIVIPSLRIRCVIALKSDFRVLLLFFALLTLYSYHLSSNSSTHQQHVPFHLTSPSVAPLHSSYSPFLPLFVDTGSEQQHPPAARALPRARLQPHTGHTDAAHTRRNAGWYSSE